MRVNTDLTLALQVSFTLSLLWRLGWCKNAGNPMTYEYDQYGNYEPDTAPGYPQYEYDNTPKYKCYSCMFVIKNGHSQGQENCRDPFRKSDINQVDCDNSCAKVYHRTGETEYLVSRNCLKNCRPHQQDNEYTECCTGNLCNTASSRPHPQLALLPCCIVLLTALTLALRRR